MEAAGWMIVIDHLYSADIGWTNAPNEYRTAWVMSRNVKAMYIVRVNIYVFVHWFSTM
jgi:hypothetical protein